MREIQFTDDYTFSPCFHESSYKIQNEYMRPYHNTLDLSIQCPSTVFYRVPSSLPTNRQARLDPMMPMQLEAATVPGCTLCQQMDPPQHLPRPRVSGHLTVLESLQRHQQSHTARCSARTGSTPARAPSASRPHRSPEHCAEETRASASESQHRSNIHSITPPRPSLRHARAGTTSG